MESSGCLGNVKWVWSGKHSVIGLNVVQVPEIPSVVFFILTRSLFRSLFFSHWFLWGSVDVSRMEDGCFEQSVSEPSHHDVLERWQLDVSAQLINQSLGLCLSARGEWAGKKRCHCDDLTSHGTSRPDSSRDRCYTMTMPKTLMRILQHRLVTIKDCCFLVAGFCTNTFTQRDCS